LRATALRARGATVFAARRQRVNEPRRHDHPGRARTTRPRWRENAHGTWRMTPRRSDVDGRRCPVRALRHVRPALAHDGTDSLPIVLPLASQRGYRRVRAIGEAEWTSSCLGKSVPDPTALGRHAAPSDRSPRAARRFLAPISAKTVSRPTDARGHGGCWRPPAERACSAGGR
jgi:hypothetical protein